MRRIPIRVKVAASLAPPLLALVTLVGVEVRQAEREVAQVRRETALATAVGGPAGIINGIQDERNWASVELSGFESDFEIPVAGYDVTRAATDDAVEAFRADVESTGSTVEATFNDALAALDELREIRQDIDDFTAPRSFDNRPFVSEIYDRYSELIQGLHEANARVTGQVRDAKLRQGTELAVLATRQTELEAGLWRQTVIAALSPNGIDTTAELTTIARMLSAFDSINERLHDATGRYAAIVRHHYPRDLAERLQTLVPRAVETGGIDDLDAYLEGLNAPMEERYQGLRDALLDEVTRRADTLDAQAAARRRLFVMLAVVTLAVAVAVAWLVSRSITRSMRSLTRQARDVAERRLPIAVRDVLATPSGAEVHVTPIEPVEVTTRDEVADVVTALNTMQDSALDLAIEQAVLRRNIADVFVNVGRRNQNLLSRQLDLITALESNETDPDALDNLFRLDHLAIRMRRNAESLLVLAAIDPPRTWTDPVRIIDVIRGAVGEVEDYHRVKVNSPEPVMILGSAAADLAHLLAELIENAATYSPPHEPVTIYGTWWRDREGYRLSVVDQGLGMPAADIAQANVRLAGSESLTVAPSKFLGHHVAGHLATRHGMHVQLDPGAFRGIVTTVDLPVRLTATPEVVPPTEPDPGSQRALGPADGPDLQLLVGTDVTALAADTTGLVAPEGRIRAVPR